MGICLYGLTICVRAGSFVPYKQIILLILANGANTEDEHNVYCLKWLCEVRLVCLIIFSVLHVLKENISLYPGHPTGHVREHIKLLVNIVKHCNHILYISFLKYFSIKSFRFLILIFVLSKPIEYESQTLWVYAETIPIWSVTLPMLRRGNSNEYPQHTFYGELKKIIIKYPLVQLSVPSCWHLRLIWEWKWYEYRGTLLYRSCKFKV